VADIVLINPKFELSFWGLEHAMPFFGKRANMPVAALPLLAALTAPEHKVMIIDENVDPIDFELCARADIVGITGMIVQRHRNQRLRRNNRRLFARCRQRAKREAFEHREGAAPGHAIFGDDWRHVGKRAARSDPNWPGGPGVQRHQRCPARTRRSQVACLRGMQPAVSLHVLCAGARDVQCGSALP
jgi:hypothetical protein